MNLLHQMADDEAASVNAGIRHVDDEDDGVPIPEIPRALAETVQEDDTRKKDKKASVKKKKTKARILMQVWKPQRNPGNWLNFLIS